MKKRIVSMILALSMMLSILPVSAFADAGAGLSSAAEETNSITYSSENEHEDVGTNSETKHQVVKIKFGAAGLPMALTGTGWSYDDATKNLLITGVEDQNTEYILDGEVSCKTIICNAAGATVYLLDGVVTGKLLLNGYGVYVLDGSYADVELNGGTVDGGTYDKLTEKDGNVRGGFFRDISGLSTDTQQQAHQLLLPENCTLNGQKETKIYIIKKYNYIGAGKNLELAVESDTGCDVWAVASTGGSVMALPAGTQNYAFTYFGSTIATISISADGKTLSASFNMIPAQNGAPMKLVPMALGATELRFNNEGQPDLTDVTYVDSLDTDAKLHRVYMGNGWGYNCYPNDSSNESILQILDQGGADFDFSTLSSVPINCPVEITNANITGGKFGENGRLTITSGKISGGTFHNVSAGISSINGNSAVEITGGTFDSLFCNGSCSITNAVIQSCDFNTYGNNTYTISDTVLGELPDGIQNLLADGQQLSTLVVRNGNVTKMNGRTLPLSTNTIYLVGEGSAELTLTNDVLSINDAPVSSYNANTSAEGKVLHITGNNDGAEIYVNKSTDPSDLKPLRITEKGLPDLTGVTAVPMTGEGMTINLYEGLGWKYATTEENGRTRTALYITTPDGNPVDLASGAINENQVPIAVEQISLVNMTVTGIVAEGSVGAQNAIIQDGTFQRDVYMDENSTIAGGSFYDVVRAYGTITGGSFIAEVQLNKNSEVTGGVFHDVQLPNYASEKTVIQNAVILGGLTGNNSEAAVSNTVSCGYIESRYLAAGQQQSKLMMTDGTVERLNDYAAATDTIYLIGNVKAEIRFSNTVTNINGAEASDYNEGTSAIGGSLTITAKNDGEPIVVNMDGTGKLPFKGFKLDDFEPVDNKDGTFTLTSPEGVGKSTLEFKCITGVNKGVTFINEIPDANKFGRYQGTIIAEEGTKYKAGSIVIGEDSIRYTPEAKDFAYDAAKNTVKYKGENYYDADPQMTLLYGTDQSETVPTAPGSYDVYVKVTADENYLEAYMDDKTYQVGTYTVADGEKLPFEGFTREDFKPIGNGDYTYTLVCTKADGVGELTLEYKGLTGVNKGKTYINRDPDIGAYGRYQVTVTAKEGAKYKPGSIDLGEYTFRYAPKAADFTYDATKNTVTYNTDKNYYDADPDMTLLYGTDQSETVPTAPGSYDVYVRVTADDNYEAVTTEKVGTYDVPEPTKPKYCYYWNTQEGKECEVGAPITLGVDKKEGNNVIWKIEGLAEDAYTITDTGTQIELQFFMPSNDVRVTNHYEPIFYTLTVDGKEERRAFGKEVTFTAPEKEGCTFTGWEVDGVPEGTDTTSETINFTMPASNVTLTPQYEKNTYTLTVDGVNEQRVFDEDVTVIAQPVEGKTFTGWKVTGLPADVDTTKATITFKMPAKNVTLTPQYTENTYTLTVNGKPEQRTVGEEVTLIARKPEGMTFKKWEIKKGLAADAVNINGDTITFTMPANDVEISAIYEKVPTPDPDPETKTHALKVFNAQIFLKDGSDVADLKAVPVGTKLKAIAYEDTETNVFKYWTGLELTEEQSTARVVEFTMPDHDVNLMAVFVTPTNKLEVTNAQVTLKDGSAVADLTAVPAGTELVATAPEKEGYTFTGWTATGIPADANFDGATVTFKMPANKVTLNAKYIANAPKKYTVTMGEKNTEYAVDADVSITAPEKDGCTFTGWEVTGLPADVDTTSETITFKMPANNVTLTPQYTENTPKTYTVTVGEENTEYAVDADVSITAPEKDGYTFTGWEVTGLSADVDTTSETITFKMPANNVTLTPQYTENAPKKYTVTMGEKNTEYAVDADVSITAPEKDGYTFTGWKVTGLSADVDTTKATITFKMPANNVTLTPQYTENTSETYTVTVGGEDTVYAVGADVTVIAPAKAGETFIGWDAVGVPEGTDTTSETITFKMPANNVTLTPQYKKDSTPTPAPSDDGGGAIVIVAAVGGAAIGVGAYIAGTTAYLKSVLPEGMAIPANRQQLAVALWTAAGKPATQSTALFNDVAADAAELQAIRWVVDTGLMSAQDGNFKPGSRVGRMEVIRTWKAYQQRG